MILASLERIRRIQTYIIRPDSYGLSSASFTHFHVLSILREKLCKEGITTSSTTFWSLDFTMPSLRGILRVAIIALISSSHLTYAVELPVESRDIALPMELETNTNGITLANRNLDTGDDDDVQGPVLFRRSKKRKASKKFKKKFKIGKKHKKSKKYKKRKY
ncbi:hypothetical protein GcM1_232012 [Golovinomyces cichoracearum]|uniref:Uncharacterized protein n=1 Tax=Golovinomyces cichoracearum TaxID=62708 RepID=A0A420IM32_9PEZI|nr:hypothetical protein GcM1_232012 [Golovinomyces cichoracearum]